VLLSCVALLLQLDVSRSVTLPLQPSASTRATLSLQLNVNTWVTLPVQLGPHMCDTVQLDANACVGCEDLQY